MLNGRRLCHRGTLARHSLCNNMLFLIHRHINLARYDTNHGWVTYTLPASSCPLAHHFVCLFSREGFEAGVPIAITGTDGYTSTSFFDIGLAFPTDNGVNHHSTVLYDIPMGRTIWKSISAAKVREKVCPVSCTPSLAFMVVYEFLRRSLLLSSKSGIWHM
jgi:hypothetical protein